MGGGKRIERVEDVLDLGDELEVRVDDVDPGGKVSLSPINPLGGDGSGGNGESAPRRSRASPSASPASGGEEGSFEDNFDAQLRGEFGRSEERRVGKEGRSR